MSAPTIDRKRVRDVLARALHNSYSNAATGGGPLMELAEIFGIKHGDDADAVADALVPQAPEVSREVTYTIALRFGDTWVPQKFGADYAPLTAEAAIERAAKYATERPRLGPTLAVRVETVVTALDRAPVPPSAPERVSGRENVVISCEEIEDAPRQPSVIVITPELARAIVALAGGAE